MTTDTRCNVDCSRGAWARPGPLILSGVSGMGLMLPLEHDPEKWLPVFPRDKREAFARRSCSNKKIERDDYSKKSHRALGTVAARLGLGRLFLQLLQGIGHHASEHRTQHRRRDEAAIVLLALRAGHQKLRHQRLIDLGQGVGETREVLLG